MASIKTDKITFLGPLEWRNLFGPKDKVSSHEKLAFRSGVRIMFLFVLMDAILLNLDLQKKDTVEISFFNCVHFYLINLKQISNNWKGIYG